MPKGVPFAGTLAITSTHALQLKSMSTLAVSKSSTAAFISQLASQSQMTDMAKALRQVSMLG